MSKEMNLEVKAFPLNEKMGNLVGFASVTINECFAVNNIKIVEGEKGLFTSMPSAKDKNGEYHDVCCPTTKEFRAEINKAVVECYKEAVQEKEKKPSIINQVKEAAKESKAQPAKESTTKTNDAR